jgi:hypothetical protein
MIVVILVAGFIAGSLLMWTLAKAAGDADRRLDELYQAFLLKEESIDGNCSEKFGQAI